MRNQTRQYLVTYFVQRAAPFARQITLPVKSEHAAKRLARRLGNIQGGVVGVAIAILSACANPPAIAVASSAASPPPSSPCAQACAAMAALSCLEGSRPGCADRLERDLSPALCETVAAAQSIGDVCRGGAHCTSENVAATMAGTRPVYEDYCEVRP